jgi:hypothetical protein
LREGLRLIVRGGRQPLDVLADANLGRAGYFEREAEIFERTLFQEHEW